MRDWEELMSNFEKEESMSDFVEEESLINQLKEAELTDFDEYAARGLPSEKAVNISKYPDEVTALIKRGLEFLRDSGHATMCCHRPCWCHASIPVQLHLLLSMKLDYSRIRS